MCWSTYMYKKNACLCLKSNICITTVPYILHSYSLACVSKMNKKCMLMYRNIDREKSKWKQRLERTRYNFSHILPCYEVIFKNSPKNEGRVNTHTHTL